MTRANELVQLRGYHSGYSFSPDRACRAWPTRGMPPEQDGVCDFVT